MNDPKDRDVSPMFNRPVSVLIATQMLSGMVVAPCFALLPVYLKELGFATVLIAGIFTIQRVSGLVASLGGGLLTDSLGRKPTLVLGQIGFFAAALVFLTMRPVPLAILWGVSGAGLGLITLSSQSYLIDHANQRHLGVLSALYAWGHTLGSTLSNTATGLALKSIGFSGLGVSLIITGAATIVFCVMLLPPGKPSGSTPQSTDDRTDGSLSYVDVARRPEVLTLGILRFLPTFSYGMQTVFVPLLLRNAGASARLIAFYAALSSVVASLAQLATGRASDRWTPMQPGLVAFSLVIACPLMIAWNHKRLPVVFAAGVVALAAAWSLSTLIPPMVSSVTEPRERGRVLGLIHVFWNGGMILGAMLGGLLFQIASSVPFVLAGVINIPSLFILLRFFRLITNEPQAR